METGGINGFTPAEVADIRSRTGYDEPAFLRLSPALLARQHPECLPSGLSRVTRWLRGLRDFDRWFVQWVGNHLLLGGPDPAVVLRSAPLVVAAYSEEHDAVVLLRFADHHVPDRLGGLVAGSRLVTVNLDCCASLGQAPDLTPGPASERRYGNFHPIVADFLSDERDQLTALSSTFPEERWARARALGEARLEETHEPRDGRAGEAMQPTTGPSRWYLEETGKTRRDPIAALAEFRSHEGALVHDVQGRAVFPVQGGDLALGGCVVSLRRGGQLVGCVHLWNVQEVRPFEDGVWLLLRDPDDSAVLWPRALNHHHALCVMVRRSSDKALLFEAIARRLA